MATYKRALSESQARRCEEARHPACKCRCHGAAHGAQRMRAERADGDAKGLTLACGCLRQMETHTHPEDCPCACHPILRAFFEALPKDDPHHLPTKDERRRRQRRPTVIPASVPVVQMAWC